MAENITCIVTLHGIGFEQPPLPGVDNSGYADPLHRHLKKCLGDALSDDPRRKRDTPGGNGVIYVESRWRDAQGHASREEGMKRLGVWCADMRHIDCSEAPLVAHDERIAHVALVYSNLEPKGPETGALLLTLETSLASTSHYASVTELLHMALTDGLAMIGHHAVNNPQLSSTRPRFDLWSRSVKHLGKLGQVAPDPAPGVLAALRFLEDDVACYVCHNEERERVRSFVFEALMRLACREDVGSIVINAHSNGTVIAFDAVKRLPEGFTGKIKAFVTAGSPLRKYVDLFQWGSQVQCPSPVEPWYNFWDACDPVADPLNPPVAWHVGDAICPAQEKLFSRIDLSSETPSCIPVNDIRVDNVQHSSGGGIQAHNYWDNESEFVPKLADIVRTSPPITFTEEESNRIVAETVSVLQQ